MIVKELEPTLNTDAVSRAGRRAEEQMAFYLRRAFAEDPQVYVFHGLRLERSGEIGQVDHLILHRWGIVIVESKSVTSRVEINERGEWTRLWDGKMRGMPSPVLQAKRQANLLRCLLADNADQLLGKLLGLMQKRFGGMPIDVLAAISDEGVIKQPRKPVEDAVCKADQVPDRLQVMLARYKAEASILGPNSKGGYSLGASEVERISDFLLARHVPAAQPMKTITVLPLSAAPKPQVKTPLTATPLPDAYCRQCQGKQITVEYGRYGYYFKCRSCEANTPIKHTCSDCEGKTRVRKSGPQFFSDCLGCGASKLFHVNEVAPAASAAGQNHVPNMRLS